MTLLLNMDLGKSASLYFSLLDVTEKIVFHKIVNAQFTLITDSFLLVFFKHYNANSETRI